MKEAHIHVSQRYSFQRKILIVITSCYLFKKSHFPKYLLYTCYKNWQRFSVQRAGIRMFSPCSRQFPPVKQHVLYPVLPGTGVRFLRIWYWTWSCGRRREEGNPALSCLTAKAVHIYRSEFAIFWESRKRSRQFSAVANCYFAQSQLD